MDYNAEGPDAYKESWRKANKEHKCCACGEAIRKGDRYHYVSGIWDGEPSWFKHCARCWLMYEAIVGNSDHGDEGQVVLTLDCGMSWEEVFDEPPPPKVAALAFLTPEEGQQLVTERIERSKYP